MNTSNIETTTPAAAPADNAGTHSTSTAKAVPVENTTITTASVAEGEASSPTTIVAGEPMRDSGLVRPSRDHMHDASMPREAGQKPRLVTPGKDRTLTQFIDDLGPVLAPHLYHFEDAVCVVKNGSVRILKPQAFRTMLEDHIVPVSNTDDGQHVKSLSSSDAGAVLQSDRFAHYLRPLEGIYPVRQPFVREGGSIELLPEGYDRASKRLTISEVLYETDWPLEKGVEYLRDLLREFPFRDNRSLAVSVAAMMTMYAIGLLPYESPVPAFLFDGNRPGLGKGLLTQIAVQPMLGYTPTGSPAKAGDEMQKFLFGAALERHPAVIFDNIVGRFQSAPLEAFLTSSRITSRILQTSTTKHAIKRSVVFVTGNQCSLGDDMARRTLRCELYSDVPSSERSIETYLDENVLRERRGQILASLYALVRSWADAGQPHASEINTSFPVWSRIIGGIIEHAGFESPCKPAAVADPEPIAADMGKLVTAVYSRHRAEALKFKQIMSIAQELGLFTGTLVTKTGKLDRKENRALSALLTSFKDRFFSELQFAVIEGGRENLYAVRPPRPK